MYEKGEDGCSCSINRLRVHYFFSMTKGIDSALKELMVDIRITETESWERSALAGKSVSLHEFAVQFSPLETALFAKAVSLFSPCFSKHVALHVLLSHPIDYDGIDL